MAGSNIIINLAGGSELQNYIRKPDGSGFDNYAELKAFKTTGQEGDFALVTSTSLFWIWDVNTGDWKNGDSGEGIPGPVKWIEVIGKPLSFPPSTHAHNIESVAGLLTTLNSKAESSHIHAIEDVTQLGSILQQKLTAPFIEGDQGDIIVLGETGLEWGKVAGMGADGKSAYEIALINGFTGTEAEWLDSLQGAQGPQGIQGPQGAAGAPGAQGIADAQGPQGIQGPQGEKGDKGDPGSGVTWRGTWSNSISYTATDAVSYNGSSYVANANNTNKVPGTASEWDLWVAKGATGATGAQGPQGPTGPTGSQGPQGVQGPEGLQGEKGDKGDPGSGVTWKGTWSNSISYTATDAVSYNGSSYVANANNTNKVPGTASEWDLWVAKGATGAQGAQGPAGTTGATGAQGAQGPQGPQGPAGTPPIASTRTSDIATDSSITVDFSSDYIIKDVSFDDNIELPSSNLLISFSNINVNTLFRTVLIQLGQLHANTVIQLPHSCDIVMGSWSTSNRNYLIVMAIASSGNYQSMGTITQSLLNNA